MMVVRFSTVVDDGSHLHERRDIVFQQTYIVFLHNITSGMHTMKRAIYCTVSALLLILVILITTVSAVTITANPDVVQKGGTVTLTITDLPDGASFSLDISGKFAVTPGEKFTFQTSNFNMPFALNNGIVSATTQGTKSTTFAVKKGDAIAQVGNVADENGYFTISQDYEITSGVYDYLTLGGRARDDTSTLSSTMNLLGTKNGPVNSAISFTIDGIDDGEVYLTVLVNGEQPSPDGFKKIIVGNGIATPTPTATATATPTETTTTTTGTTGSPTATQTTTTTGTTTVTGTGTSTVTSTAVPTTSSSGTSATTATTATATSVPSTFTSADRQVRLTVTGVDYAALMMVKEVTPPEDWLMITKAYTIAPNSIVFAKPGTISFTIPSSAGDYAFFIGSLKNNQWTVLPSQAGTSTIDATIDGVGTYALMAYKPESTLPATTAAAGQATTAETAATPKGTPKVASIAQASIPTTTSAKSPLDLVPVFGALAICTLAVLVIRKDQ